MAKAVFQREGRCLLKQLFFKTIPIGLAVLSLGGWMVAQNPTTPTRVAYLEGNKIVENTKDFNKLKAVRDQAEAELKPLNDRLLTFESKIQANTATAAERQEYNTLRQTAQQTLEKWQTRQNQLLGPLAETANQTIAKVAKAQNVGFVFDSRIANQNGVIVWADDSLDLTNAVVQALPK